MNNNEMISVPRELLERCVVPNEDVWIEHTNRAGEVFINALDELESLLAETPASIVAENPEPAAVAPHVFCKGFNTLEQKDGKYTIKMVFASSDDAWPAFEELCRLASNKGMELNQ